MGKYLFKIMFDSFVYIIKFSHCRFNESHVVFDYILNAFAHNVVFYSYIAIIFTSYNVLSNFDDVSTYICAHTSNLLFAYLDCMFPLTCYAKIPSHQ